jgi:arylsulfatase A-like enzyme
MAEKRVRWQSSPVSRWLVRSAGLTVLTAGLASVLWRGGLLRQAERPNVIVYLVDTLRPDHLGVYGYERDTSPNLDAFARDAVVFENAYSPSSWTRPATASLMTGLSPLRHRAIGRLDVLGSKHELLSEHLRAAGYRTLGLVTNPNVIALWGFDRGFESYQDIDSSSRGTRADTVIDRVLEALRALPAEEPVFLYIHTLDPHAPYFPPPPYDRKFSVPGAERIARYDGEIAFGDVHFGRLLDHLRERQQYDDALIVFLSDHGEELQDHSGTGHGHTLFEEVVRVPLLIKLPNGEHAGARARSPVTLMDVLPTVLAAVGLSVPQGLDGTDLRPLMRGDAEPPERPLFFDLDLDQNRGLTDIVRGVRLHDLKYLRRLRPVQEERLFDVAVDPGEQVDRAASAPADAARLSRLLDTHLAATSTGIHLLVSNSETSGPHVCFAAARTTGRFVHMATRLFEERDRAEFNADGTELHVVVELANYPHPTGGTPRVIVDTDALVFDVEPRDAAIAIESLAQEGTAPCPLWLGPTHRRAEDARTHFRTTQDDLNLLDVAQLLHDPGPRPATLPMGIYLAVVPAAPKAQDVPEAVRDRLRALGYTQ